MVQKFNAYAIRVGTNQERTWNNYCFPTSKKEQIEWIKKDKLIHDYFSQILPDISRLRMEGDQNKIFLEIFLPEIDLIVGENKERIKEIVHEVKSLLGNEKITLRINLREVKNVYTDAQAIANLTASQVKKQTPVMLVLRTMVKKIILEQKRGREAKVKGGEFIIKGILDKSGIAQTKKKSWGNFPFSTIDSNIELGRKEVITSRGKIGIKVALYKGKFWRKKQRSIVNQTI